jgi:hypothetical protein
VKCQSWSNVSVHVKDPLCRVAEIVGKVEERGGCWAGVHRWWERDAEHFILSRKTNMLTGLAFLGITATFLALAITDKDESLVPRSVTCSQPRLFIADFNSACS